MKRSEIRKKSAFQTAEYAEYTEKRTAFLRSFSAYSVCSAVVQPLVLITRISFFGFLLDALSRPRSGSDFGFRISDFGASARLFRRRTVILLCAVGMLMTLSARRSFAQPGIFTKDHLIEYTPDWKGERFPDGRPKVGDDLLQRMKAVSIEEAWAVLKRHGYNAQFEGNWVLAGPKEPVLVGRAVTAYFQPVRPDVNNVIKAKGEKEGRIGGQNSWVIDTLVKGDAIVVDLMGKVIDGTFMGDNLANSIWAKTGGNGLVINGGARDIQGVEEVPDFPVFNRGWDPSAIADVMLMGINTPIRIGRASVMPGDVVLGKKEGVIFIPAHLAQEVVETSEIVRLRDEFGHLRLRQGKYTPGQIDRKWSDDIEKDFDEWLKTKGKEMTPYQREKLLKGRTW